MNSRMLPWATLAGVLMIGFIVWLGAQMSRSERANEILIILVICFALAGLAFGISLLGRRRGESQDEDERPRA